MLHAIKPHEHGALGEPMAHAVQACVHCGFCLAACPTYQEFGQEMDSPRGRIVLMKQVLEGTLPAAAAQVYVDRCIELHCEGKLTAEQAAAAITAEQAAGKVIVIKSPGGLRVPRLAPGSALTNAAGIALLIGGPVPAQFISFFRNPGMAVPDAGSATAQSAPTVMVMSEGAAQTVFGADIATLKPGQAGSVLASSLRYTETPSPAYNVVAMLPGSDPALKGQFVAIGSHNDHDGVGSTAVDHWRY
jgi:ferredoxin